MHKIKLVALSVLCALPAHGQIIISETTEGSGLNKAIELTNIGSESINLSTYSIKLASNGASDWTSSPLVLEDHNLSPRHTYVIAHPDADAALVSKANLTNNQVTAFNGDDIIGLFKEQQLIDIVGTLGIRENFNQDTSLQRIDVTPNTTFNPAQWHSTGVNNDWQHIGIAPDYDDDFTPSEPPVQAIRKTIMELQGDGWASPYTDPAKGQYQSEQTFQVSGVITHIQDNADLGEDLPQGFFIQDPQGDDNPNTSDGLFIQGPIQGGVVGDLIEVTGKVIEHYGSTQFIPSAESRILDHGYSIQPTVVTRLNSDRYYAQTLERHEGMLVRFTAESDMHVSRSFAFDPGPQRYNMVLAYQQPNEHPHHRNQPGSQAAIKQADCNQDQQLIVEATQAGTPETPIAWYPDISQSSDGHSDNHLTIGDQVANLQGIIGYSHSDYRLFITEEATSASFNPVAKQNSPGLIEGNVKVATFNTQGVFTSRVNGPRNPAIDNDSPSGFVTGGANNQEELDLQVTKITAAIKQLNPDIVALLQVENNGYSAHSAIGYLLNRLNQNQDPHHTYQVAKLSDTSSDFVGENATASFILYRPALFKFKQLELLAMPGDDDLAIAMNDTLLATFDLNAKDQPTTFTLAVADLVDRNQHCSQPTETQGGCSTLREQASEKIAQALEQHSGHKILLGSFHAYPKEDAITRLTGLNDMASAPSSAHYLDSTTIRDTSNPHYSVENHAASGRVDYIFISPSLTSQFIDSAPWAINANESELWDYQHKTANTSWHRSSRHDPVLLNLNFELDERQSPEDNSSENPSAETEQSSGGSLGLISLLLFALMTIRRTRGTQA
ncbi:ExeM/NucH family extracellular endonuclease [Vibrio fujianensis]|uniref:ExeM/NucH family extracellular endonuclease n=2 Tax=Vibrio TaxID=662 RepID=UPI000C16CE82|nr:ExeM/NucH family extracellular endonuclease [Vibrio fujianensis]